MEFNSRLRYYFEEILACIVAVFLRPVSHFFLSLRVNSWDSTMSHITQDNSNRVMRDEISIRSIVRHLHDCTGPLGLHQRAELQILARALRIRPIRLSIGWWSLSCEQS